VLLGSVEKEKERFLPSLLFRRNGAGLEGIYDLRDI